MTQDDYLAKIEMTHNDYLARIETGLIFLFAKKLRLHYFANMPLCH